MDQIVPKALLLSGLNNSSEMTKGGITLLSFAGGVTKETLFQVVARDMTYNAILGHIRQVCSTINLAQVINSP